MFMKKILMTFTLILSALFANAQIATENSNALDNISIGLVGGASTPLEFKQSFKNINPMVGLTLDKAFSPIFGIQIEGMSWIQDHNNQYVNLFQAGTVANPDQTVNKKWFKAINAGLNGKINLTNLFKGYQGKPRVFEVGAVGGLGALFYLGEGEYLSAKTGLDFAFNLGKSRASSIVVTPAIYWNLSGNHFDEIHFNKNNAQFALMLSYVYHFKNSNGTHYFKTYDIGAMNNEIERLNVELAKKPKEVIKHTETVKTVKEYVQSEYIIQFAQNSSQLSNEAKDVLDNVNGRVTVVAYASPEGTDEYNKALSERRAAAVADYLINKRIKVISYIGHGCVSETSNRIAIVKIIAD